MQGYRDTARFGLYLIGNAAVSCHGVVALVTSQGMDGHCVLLFAVMVVDWPIYICTASFGRAAGHGNQHGHLHIRFEAVLLSSLPLLRLEPWLVRSSRGVQVGVRHICQKWKWNERKEKIIGVKRRMMKERVRRGKGFCCWGLLYKQRR